MGSYADDASRAVRPSFRIHSSCIRKLVLRHERFEERHNVAASLPIHMAFDYPLWGCAVALSCSAPHTVVTLDRGWYPLYDVGAHIHGIAWRILLTAIRRRSFAVADLRFLRRPWHRSCRSSHGSRTQPDRALEGILVGMHSFKLPILHFRAIFPLFPPLFF